MALRSIIDIDVNTRQFDAFVAKFQAFQQQAQVNVGVTGTGAPGAAPAAPAPPGGAGGGQPPPAAPGAAPGAGPQPPRPPALPTPPAGPANRFTDALDRANRAGRELAKSFGAMREHTTGILRNVREMASRLLSISGTLGLLTGAATGFGFLGFNALAGSAARMRQQALQAGTTIPGFQGARAALGRFGDVGTMLNNLRGIIQDPSQAPQLATRMKGLLGRDLTGNEDTAQLLEQLLPSIRREGEGTGLLSNPRTRGMQAETLGITKLMSLAELNALMARPVEEVDRQAAESRRNRQEPGMQFSDEDARKFDDFMSKMDLAGKQIEITFLKGLAPLAGPLSELGTAISDTIRALLENPKMAQWIRDFGEAIRAFGKYIGSDKFQKDVLAFINGVGQLADRIIAALRTLDLIPQAEGQKPEGEQKDTFRGFQWSWKKFTETGNPFEYHIGKDAPDIFGRPRPGQVPGQSADPFGKLLRWLLSSILPQTIPAKPGTPLAIPPPIPPVVPAPRPEGPKPDEGLFHLQGFQRQLTNDNPIQRAAFRVEAPANENAPAQNAAFRPDASGRPTAPAAPQGTNQGPWDKPIPVLPWPLPLPVTIMDTAPAGGEGVGWAGVQRASLTTGGGRGGGGEGGGEANTIPPFAGPGMPPVLPQLPGDTSWGDFGTRANNPGNMNFAPGQGAAGRFAYRDAQTGEQHTMGVFSTMQQGVAAAYRLLVSNQARFGKTVEGALKGWAQNSYADKLIKSLGLKPGQEFDVTKGDAASRLLAGVFQHEGRRGTHSATEQQIREGVELGRNRLAGRPDAAPAQQDTRTRIQNEADRLRREQTQPGEQRAAPTAPPVQPAQPLQRSAVQQAHVHIRLNNETGGSVVIAGGQLAA